MTNKGLTSSEANRIYETFGPNVLENKVKIPGWKKFLMEFKSPIIYVLLFVALITFVMQDYADTIIILAVTIFNATIGFIQERKAEKTLEALTKLIELKAKVLRDGKVVTIEASKIVPGDIVILDAGDKIPADGVFIDGKNIGVIEASLTGESYPVIKLATSIDDVLANLPITEANDPESIVKTIQTVKSNNSFDDESRAYMSTNLNTGRGRMLVLATGMSTEIGKISRAVKRATEEPTPLQVKIRNLTRVIISVIMFIIFFVILIGLIKNIEIQTIFKTSISLGVSAIPEGLPIVVTVTLAIGGWRMAKQNAVLKNLSSVSTLAGATVICTDKTGTITEGSLFLDQVSIPIKNSANEFHEYLPLVNDAYYSENDRNGDVLDIAILEYYDKNHGQYQSVRDRHERLDEIPFDSDYKFMASLNSFKGSNRVLVKGAPDVLIDRCKFNSDEDRKLVEKELYIKNKNGFRTILLASKDLEKDKLDHKDINELVFHALLCFIDPIRSDVKLAVEACYQSGIKTVMITGDHVETAKYIAKQAQIYSDGDIAITGVELNQMSEEEVLQILDKLSVVARATPMNKIQLIEIFQKRGEVVAMTGDGVNDAPALAKAEIGIAMGINGTDVARDASDMVLVDDKFSTIVNGVEEARVVHDNLKKVISFLFSTSAGEILTILMALILDYPLPLLAAQILWLNLVTDGFLDVALATERKEPGEMEYPPSRYNKSILDKLIYLRIVYMAVIMMVGSLLVFDYFLEQTGDEVYARTAILLTLCMYQWFNVFNMRSEKRSIFQVGVFSNKAINYALILVIALMVAVIYTPIGNTLLSLSPVGLEVWALGLLVSSSILVFEEIRKFLVRR